MNYKSITILNDEMYTVKTTVLLFKTSASLGSSSCPRIHSPSVSAFQVLGVQASTSQPSITDHTLRKMKHCYFTLSNPSGYLESKALGHLNLGLVLHEDSRVTSLWGLILSNCHKDCSGTPLTLLFGQKMH